MAGRLPYKITELVPKGYILKDAQCTGGTFKTIDNGVDVEVDAGADVVCTFSAIRAHDTAMAEETRRFVYRRVDNLLSHGPDRARLLRRLQTPGPGGSQGGLKLSGSKPDGSGPASSGEARPLSSARSPNSEATLSATGGSGRSLSYSSAGGMDQSGVMSLGGTRAHNGDGTVAEDGVPWVEAFPSSAQMRQDAF
ncbi:MAG: hypothetical protein GY877_03155, partial [Hyphomicrobium sp.]|nr:hypothetical protein [Hyphomicrobium sp.]